MWMLLPLGLAVLIVVMQGVRLAEGRRARRRVDRVDADPRPRR